MFSDVTLVVEGLDDLDRASGQFILVDYYVVCLILIRDCSIEIPIKSLCQAQLFISRVLQWAVFDDLILEQNGS